MSNRHLFVFLPLTALITLSGQPTAAQSQGRLLGVPQNAIGGSLPLVAADPTTGAQTTLASLPFSCFRSSAFDSTTGHYFLAGDNCQTGASQILTVDTTTGAVVSNVSNPSDIVALQFDLAQSSTTEPGRQTVYCNFAYSALACLRMGMSGSASFQRAKKS